MIHKDGEAASQWVTTALDTNPVNFLLWFVQLLIIENIQRYSFVFTRHNVLTIDSQNVLHPYVALYQCHESQIFLCALRTS